MIDNEYMEILKLVEQRRDRCRVMEAYMFVHEDTLIKALKECVSRMTEEDAKPFKRALDTYQLIENKMERV